MLARWRRELEDDLRYDPRIRAWQGRRLLRRDYRPPDDATAELLESLHRLSSAARLLAGRPPMDEVVRRMQARAATLGHRPVDLTPFYPGADEREVQKAAVIKPRVSEREKGVLFLSFENQVARLLMHGDLAWLAERYDIVHSPTHSPPHSTANQLLAARWPGPIFYLISHVADIAHLHSMAPNIVPVPLYASSWANPRRFAPRPFGERDIDILMVANFAKLKRHFSLFQALRRLPTALRVVLIGQVNDGRDAGTMRREANWYGVADRFEVLEDQDVFSVYEHMSRSKVHLTLSRLEGSAVVMAEAMMAGAAVGVPADAHIGSMAFVNEQTGRLLRRDDLAAGLVRLLADAPGMDPRAWAVEHIACDVSTARLNALLREHALAAGEPWTRDISLVEWAPYPILPNEADRYAVREDYEQIAAHAGVTLRRDW